MLSDLGPLGRIHDETEAGFAPDGACQVGVAGLLVDSEFHLDRYREGLDRDEQLSFVAGVEVRDGEGGVSGATVKIHEDVNLVGQDAFNNAGDAVEGLTSALVSGLCDSVLRPLPAARASR